MPWVRAATGPEQGLKHSNNGSEHSYFTHINMIWSQSVPLYLVICDALPRKVHKVTGSERRYTPEQIVWPNFVDFELINFSVPLATHSPPLNLWALIFIKKWLKSVIFRLAVDLNAAYFTRKYTVFKRCSGWRHCDKGHVWHINGNLVFPRILSLPLNERSLFLSLVNRLQIW